MSIFALPESSRKVLVALTSSNNITIEQIKEKTGLSERTLRFAVQKLKERGLVSDVVLFSDRRRKVFRLKEAHV